MIHEETSKSSDPLLGEKKTVISDPAQNQRRHWIYNEAVFSTSKKRRARQDYQHQTSQHVITFFQGAAALLGALIPPMTGLLLWF